MKYVVGIAPGGAAPPQERSGAAVHDEISVIRQVCVAIDAFLEGARGPYGRRRIKHEIAVELHAQRVRSLNQRLAGEKPLPRVKYVDRCACGAEKANHREDRQEGEALRCHLHH